MKTALSTILLLSVVPGWTGPFLPGDGSKVSARNCESLQGAPPKAPPSTPEQKGEKKPPAAEAKPDLHAIRKVNLSMEDWADEDNAREKYTKALEQHTCLKVVDSSEGADATLRWQNQGMAGTYLELVDKNDEVLWSKRGLRSPLAALKHAVGCPK